MMFNVSLLRRSLLAARRLQSSRHAWVGVVALAGWWGGCSQPEARQDQAGPQTRVATPAPQVQPAPSAVPTPTATATPTPTPSVPPTALAPADEPVDVLAAPDRSQFEPVVREQLLAAEKQAAEAPQDAEAAGQLGMLYHAYGLLSEAARTYQRACALAPEAFGWQYLRAHVAMTLGDMPRAVECFQKAAELKSDYVPAGVWLGRALMDAGDLPGALRVLLALHEAHPDDDLVSYTYGVACQRAKEPVWALEFLKPVLDRHPEYGAVRAAVAQTFADLGQPERSEAVATAWPPNDLSPPMRDPELLAIYRETVGTEADLRRAAAYRAAGDAAQAAAAYTSALGHSPNNVEALVGRAEMELQTGDIAGGEDDLRAVLAIDADHVVALMRMGQLHLLRGEAEEAQKLVVRARALAPENTTLLAMEARMATLRGDHRAAAEALREAVTRSPGNAELQYELGMSLWGAGDKEPAIEAFRHAVEINPKYTPALQALADAYLNINRSDTADTWYQRAYDAGSVEPITCVRVAALALKAAEYDRAEAVLKRGLEYSPDDVELNDALSRFYALCPFASYRNGQEALRLARKLYPTVDAATSMRALYTLAAAYAEIGDFQQARDLLTEAIARAEADGDVREAERLQSFRRLYEKNIHVYDVE